MVCSNIAFSRVYSIDTAPYDANFGQASLELRWGDGEIVFWSRYIGEGQVRYVYVCYRVRGAVGRGGVEVSESDGRVTSARGRAAR